MEASGPTFTAIVPAMVRAAHLLFDGEPKIFADPLALELSGAGTASALQARLDALHAQVAANAGPERAAALFRYLHSIMTLRSRYTEDELDGALQRGVGQYVLLGAGLDSFAYRRRDLAGVLQVFEIDLPTTQEWKRARLRELHIDIPSNLTFIPIDFERQTLMDTLRAGGYRSETPAFFSWLGTTQYLTAEAVFKTLREVASAAAGSEIVFQYQVSEAVLDEESRQLMEVLKAAVRGASGESWLSLFDPTSLAAQVRELGFTQVWDFGPEAAFTRYFAGRTDGLPVPYLSHLMKARVGGAP